MTDSALTVDLNTPAASTYFEWRARGNDVSIRFNLNLVERMERDIVDTFKAITKPGSEIGGLLLGRVDPNNAVIAVEDFECIPCGYARGPLYLLTDAEAAQVGHAIAAASARGQSVLGFFRSNTRKDLALTSDDLKLINEYFSEPHSIILAVKPMAMKPGIAGLFLWDRGRIDAGSPAGQFPFRASELLKGEFTKHLVRPAGPEAPVPPVPPTPEPEPRDAARPAPVNGTAKRNGTGPSAVQESEAPKPLTASEPPKPAKPPIPPKSQEAAAAPEPQKPDVPAAGPAAPAPDHSIFSSASVPGWAASPVAAEPEPSGRKLPLIWIGAGAAVILAVILVWFLTRKTADPKPVVTGVDNSSLALRIEPNAGQLQLTWNRSAQVIQTAKKAVLSIRDGDHTEDVELDLGQLKTGSVVYTPLTNDVSFRLEVTDTKDVKTASESVRVLGRRPTALGEQPAAKPAETPKAAAPAPAEAAGESQTSKPEAVSAEPAPEPAAATQPVTAAPAPASSLAARLSPAPILEAPDNIAIGSSGGARIMNPSLAAPPPPEAPKAAAPAPPQSAGQQPVRVGGNVQEAKLVHRVTPAYPVYAKQARITGTVRLEATVGRDGRVQAVRVLSGPALLHQAAIDAVRQWRYSPTLLNGQPVAVVTQVDLNFSLGR